MRTETQVAEPPRFKCFTCHNILDTEHLVGEKKNTCPVCGEMHLQEMCRIDHCHCSHPIAPGIAYCPICKEAICPVIDEATGEPCGCHDVTQISRVTGYLQDVSGWNAAKQQELKDRVRHDAVTGLMVGR